MTTEYRTTCSEMCISPRSGVKFRKVVCPFSFYALVFSDPRRFRDTILHTSTQSEMVLTVIIYNNRKTVVEVPKRHCVHCLHLDIQLPQVSLSPSSTPFLVYYKIVSYIVLKLIPNRIFILCIMYVEQILQLSYFNESEFRSVPWALLFSAEC